MTVHPRPSTKNIRGFTLIEILLFLAIVAALVAVLFAALSQARERSRRTTCQSNLRQIALAIQQYVQDNDGAYPVGIGSEAGEGGRLIASDWNHKLLPYVKSALLFYCPTSPDEAPNRIGIPAAQKAFTNSYTYNAMRLNLFPQTGPKGITESLLANAATVWVNVDDGWITPDEEYHYLRRVEKTSCGRKVTGSTLHSGGGNYSFVDGHVKWLTPEAFGEIECLNEPLPFPFTD